MTNSKPQSLYGRIGEKTIANAITEFYQRAFKDPMINHFFMRSDIDHLTTMQIDFTIGMLGGPSRYSGKSIKDAHLPFTIRAPHFGRRQVLMQEVLEEFIEDRSLREAWLNLEEKLRAAIINCG